MLIYIQGPDSFLAKEAIRSMKAKYLEKNPTGSELVEIDCSDTGSTRSWADLKAIPLFATSRLIIISQVGSLVVAEQVSLASILVELPATSIVVVWDGKALKPDSELAKVSAQASKKIPAQPLISSELAKWIKKQAEILGQGVSAEQVKNLISQYGSDLWAIQTDLATGHLPSNNNRLSDWSHAQADKPFIFFDDVRSSRWLALKQHLVNAFNRGEALELTIGSLAAAVRQSVGDEGLRRKITTILSEVDLALKTGLIEGGDAVALLIAYLPDRQNRVQWGELWLELDS